MCDHRYSRAGFRILTPTVILHGSILGDLVEATLPRCALCVVDVLGAGEDAAVDGLDETAVDLVRVLVAGDQEAVAALSATVGRRRTTRRDASRRYRQDSNDSANTPDDHRHQPPTRGQTPNYTHNDDDDNNDNDYDYDDNNNNDDDDDDDATHNHDDDHPYESDPDSHHSAIRKLEA
ncbi:hypothetical protein FIBSPDRAFT_1012510 [Athelia psychrophila]|uniref:Uncharacterized protein n=1 Tax=Athelia psychrophila TaxID=1759441 RepID=A0A166MN55_9AGAM|nr:hypothetical protein FIBSPDRAFT_1012510 [Fibularhizoctonia sp. CBS 109695]